MMNVDDCELRYHCRNANKRCLFCDGKSQYREVKYKEYNLRKYQTPSKKKKGMGLEEVVRIEYNKHMAQRMPLSGGIDGFEGDIRTSLTLIECKEATIKEGGKKQITIKKNGTTGLKKKPEIITGYHSWYMVLKKKDKRLPPWMIFIFLLNILTFWNYCIL